MKIICFNDEYPAISETFVLEHLRGLVAGGHEVRVIARRAGEDASHPLCRDLDPIVRPLYTGERDLWALGRQLVLALRDRRARACLDPRRFGRRALSRKMLSWAEPWIEAGPCDAILAEHGHEGAIAAELRSAGLATAPIVTIFHGSDITRAGTTKKYARLFSTGEAFVANSRFTKDRLIAAGCPEQRIRVIHMGVRSSEFTPTNPEPTPDLTPDPDQTLSILSIARLVEVKGIEYGIRAIAELRDRGVAARYTIIGDGPLRGPLEGLAAELGLDAAVRFLGARPRPDVVETLRATDVLIAPSVTLANGEAEALGVAPMEAMAMRRPVIASRSGGLPEVVAEGETGLLVPERDPGAIADAVERLVGDPDLRVSLGNAGRERVIERFDADRLNGQLCDLLERVATR